MTHLKRIVGDLDKCAAENGARLIKTPNPQDSPNVVNKENSGDLSNVVLKGDINEELVRLKTHVVYWVKSSASANPSAKKLISCCKK